MFAHGCRLALEGRLAAVPPAPFRALLPFSRNDNRLTRVRSFVGGSRPDRRRGSSDQWRVPMRKLTFLACLIFAFSVPVQAQDVATIQRLADQFAEAYNKKGAEGVGAMYTDDAIVVPPEADIRTGRRDIQAFWTQQ